MFSEIIFKLGTFTMPCRNLIGKVLHISISKFGFRTKILVIQISFRAIQINHY